MNVSPVLYISYLRQEPPPRGALNNNHSVLSVRTSTSSVHSTPQTPEQIASFLRYSLAPRRGVLLRVSLFTQRNAFSPVDTTHVYEDPSDAPLPILSISYSPRGALLAHEVAPPSQGGAQLDAADIRMSSPKTAPGPPSRPQLGKPILAPAEIALAKATGSITSPRKSS